MIPNDQLPLTLSQKAMLAAERVTAPVGYSRVKKGWKPEYRTYDEIAKETGVNRNYLKFAKSIVRKNPELAMRVKAGEISVETAYRQLKGKPAKSRHNKPSSSREFFIPKLAVLPSPRPTSANPHPRLAPYEGSGITNPESAKGMIIKPYINCAHAQLPSFTRREIRQLFLEVIQEENRAEDLKNNQSVQIN
jgi:hypothetical protein